MNFSILELKSIGYMDPDVAKKIDEWIEKHIGQSHVKIEIHRPENPDEQQYRIKAAYRMLGENIAKNSNMYPTFEKTKIGFECMMSTLYFKNEYGK